MKGGRMTSVMIGSNTDCGRVCYCCYSCRGLFWTTTETNCVGGGVIAWHITGVRFAYCFGWTAIIGNATAIIEKLWHNRQTLCISTLGALSTRFVCCAMNPLYSRCRRWDGGIRCVCCRAKSYDEWTILPTPLLSIIFTFHQNVMVCSFFFIN